MRLTEFTEGPTLHVRRLRIVFNGSRMLARRKPLSEYGLDASSAPVAGCRASCRLAECGRGCEAMIVGVACAAPDACRLRALGVFEGTRVTVVDSRNGLLLNVRGSRLALGAAIAAAITVVPVGAGAPGDHSERSSTSV